MTSDKILRAFFYATLFDLTQYHYQAYNGLLVRLTNGSVFTVSSGPKYQLGWGVLDDLLLVPRMQMLPLPP